MAAQGKENWMKVPFAYTVTCYPWLLAMAFTAVVFMSVGRPDAETFFGGFIGVPVMWWVEGGEGGVRLCAAGGGGFDDEKKGEGCRGEGYVGKISGVE
ncbi:hypothetical protein EV426DRAFT_715213 [Tirmania nivea]|nr:hypothetical protein EV426DRAFT_715213 [Tirmania nivea]